MLMEQGPNEILHDSNTIMIDVFSSCFSPGTRKSGPRRGARKMFWNMAMTLGSKTEAIFGTPNRS